MECSLSKVRNKNQSRVKIEDHEVSKRSHFWCLESIIYKGRLKRMLFIERSTELVPKLIPIGRHDGMV